MKVRFYIDLNIREGGIERVNELHGKLMDAIADVLIEEKMQAVDGLRAVELRGVEHEKKKG